MIERIVLVKLVDAEANAASRRQLALDAERTIAKVPGVRRVRAGTPADRTVAGKWDLCIVVEFDDLDAVARYSDDPVHRAFVDERLRPRVEVLKAWNFVTVEPD